MNTPTERSVEEIVEEFKKEFDYFFDPEKFGYKHSGSIKEALVNDWLTQTLQTERQKQAEVVERINSINTREMNVGENRSKYLAFNKGENHMKVKILQALTPPNNPN